MRPKTSIDEILRDLRRLGEIRGATLYSIVFRNAGVAIQWHESERAGPEPGSPENLSKTWRNVDELQEWTKRGLVIYHYYPTLSEAIEGEVKRLEER